ICTVETDPFPAASWSGYQPKSFLGNIWKPRPRSRSAPSVRRLENQDAGRNVTWRVGVVRMEETRDTIDVMDSLLAVEKSMPPWRLPSGPSVTVSGEPRMLCR